MTRLSLLVLCLLALPAEARLYQWQNPGSGSVELSGEPPAWYRSPGGGPRVQVFHNGVLIDDTAYAVDPERGEELRDAAFAELERRQQEEALKRLERAARREQARVAESERLAAEEPDAPDLQDSIEAMVEDVPENLDEQVIDRLKSLVEQWDRRLGTR